MSFSESRQEEDKECRETTFYEELLVHCRDFEARSTRIPFLMPTSDKDLDSFFLQAPTDYC